MIKKVVLTGGPCAGKSTAIAKISKVFTEKGYEVLVVPETATEIINMGIKPFGDNKINMYDFQKFILSHQLEKERLISYNLLGKDVKMEELYKLNIPDNELEYMLEVNPEIKELSVDEVKKHIDILKQINLKEDQIKEIFISCPLYLSRNIEDVLDLFKKLLNYKIVYLNYFIEADPFILLRDDYEIDEYVKTQTALGRDLNSIIDEFELNPYLIDEWL